MASGTVDQMNADRARSRRTTSRAWLSVALMCLLQLPLTGWIFPGQSFAAQVKQEAAYWGMAAVVLAYIVLVERRPLSSVNLRVPTWKNVGIGVAAGLIMLAGIALLYIEVLPALGPTTSANQLKTVLTLPLWFRIAIVIRAAFFEEIFYRGFVIERLSELTGRRWMAAGISLVAFTYAHVGYWGWAHVLIAGFGGCILTGVYMWRRDLGCNMTAHLVTDAVGLLVG